jgi:predicted nucleic acid-binding protein
MKSLVIDTNVAVRWMSSRRMLLGFIKTATEYDIVYSDELADEYERILRSNFGLTRQSAHSTVGRFCRLSRKVHVDFEYIGSGMRDPSDEPILALCNQCRIDIFVSDDLDFTQKMFECTKLLSSNEFEQVKGERI